MELSARRTTSSVEPLLGTWAAPIVVALLFAGAAFLCVQLGLDQAMTHFHENGLVEITTPIFYVITAILYLLWRKEAKLRSFVPPLMLLLMAIRERDGDKWFTDKSVLSTGYYFDNPGVGYGQRILVGLIVGAIGITILKMFWDARRRIVKALRNLQPYSVSLAVGFLMLAASLVLDGIARKVLWLTGVDIGHVGTVIGGICEETAELGIALAFLAALFQLRFDPARNALPDPRS